MPKCQCDELRTLFDRHGRSDGPGLPFRCGRCADGIIEAKNELVRENNALRDAVAALTDELRKAHGRG